MNKADYRQHGHFLAQFSDYCAWTEDNDPHDVLAFTNLREGVPFAVMTKTMYLSATKSNVCTFMFGSC